MTNLFNSPRTTTVVHATAGMPPSTASFDLWTTSENSGLNMGVMGLYGCTLLVVVSKKGVYMTHYFELPSFTRPREAFDVEVLDTLTIGGSPTLLTI